MRTTRFATIVSAALGLLGLVLALGIHAGEPHGVKNCGFDKSNAVVNGIVRVIAGQGLDCIIWGCIPVLSILGGGSAVVEEIDSNCAGAVYEGSDGWSAAWDYDSVDSARDAARSRCKRRYNACELALVFRHAAAGYASEDGKFYWWAQASDIPTATEIARGRCERATGRPCKLIFKAENSG